MASERATGKVKWFNNAKGYGFILPDGGGEDLFAHYSSIEMDGYKTLKAGQDVSFDVVEGPKGSHAVAIRGVAGALDAAADAATDLEDDIDADAEADGREDGDRDAVDPGPDNVTAVAAGAARSELADV